MTDRYGGLRVEKRSLHEGQDVCKQFLLEVQFRPEAGLAWQDTLGRRRHTVRSLIKVDFPAPLGPTIPTRLEQMLDDGYRRESPLTSRGIAHN